MDSNLSFSEYQEKKPEENLNTEIKIDTSTTNIAPNKPETSFKKKINFEEMPQESKDILNNAEKKAVIEKYTKEENIPMPYDTGGNTNSYLSLVLSPNLRDLEMMIRGLEFVKRFNPLTNKEEIILRKISDHPLNEYGINTILAFLRVYCSPEIKLGRKRTRDYYLSMQHVSRSVVRLIYKNLKNFGMDTQIKQRNAKSFCNAIIEFVDASFSRSIEGKENDLSRATEFKIEGNIDTLNDPAKLFTKPQKEALKN